MSKQTQVEQSRLPSPRYVSGFLIGISLIFGLTLGFLVSSLTTSLSGDINQPSTQTFYDESYLNKVYELLSDQYIGDIPDKDVITQGLIKGLISSLEDEYTYFLDPEESQDYLSSRSPDFEGIGVTLKFSDQNTEVETVLSGYPAERAGIQAKDIILEVNGENTEGITPSVVASKIRGPKGTEVKLKLYRPEKAEILEISLIRENIDISNINYKSLGNGIYKIDIYQFIDQSVEEFNRSWDNVASELKSKKDLKGLVVDLRNNPGGYVYSVRYILEDFLKTNAVLMYEETKNQGRIEYKDRREGRFEDVPVVVLVNEGSASSSEIFAAAIQDNGRGKVVGMPTVGKGVEQQLINNLPDESLLIMVFQKWLTPSGRHINAENPIQPDYKVKYTNEDFQKDIDPQLNKALEILK